MIYGLEDDYYCAHTPIPVEVDTADISEWMRIQIDRFDPAGNFLLQDGDGEYILADHNGLTPNILIAISEWDTHPMLDDLPLLYKASNGRYRLDLSMWIRPFMRKFGYVIEYTSDVNGYVANETKFKISFISSNDERQEIEKSFVHCSLNSWKMEYDRKPVPMWDCHPFSVAVDIEDTLYSFVANDDIDLSIIDRDIDRVGECCHGTYVRWLNEYGDYSYWLFKHTRIIDTESSEYFRTKRNIFDTDRSSNEDTVGFDMTEKISVKAIVEKKILPHV